MCHEKMNKIAEVLKEAKILAREYREITGKPLGITGEVGEFSAVQLLHKQNDFITNDRQKKWLA